MIDSDALKAEFEAVSEEQANLRERLAELEADAAAIRRLLDRCEKRSGYVTTTVYEGGFSLRTTTRSHLNQHALDVLPSVADEGGHFTSTKLRKRLIEEHPDLEAKATRPAIANLLGRLKDAGDIQEVRASRGRLPALYRLGNAKRQPDLLQPEPEGGGDVT